MPGDKDINPVENTDDIPLLFSPIMKYFAYKPLPLHLQPVSKGFHDLAHEMEGSIPPGPEKSAGLRKLLEAKDCFVRANL